MTALSRCRLSGEWLLTMDLSPSRVGFAIRWRARAAAVKAGRPFVWSALAVRRSSRRARYRCAICGGHEGYRPIGAEHLAILAEYGHPYSADDYETMSWRTYSCRTCESTDRDRLYALYVKRFLAERRGRRVRVLDLAPGAALSPFIRNQPDVDYRSADLYAEGADDVVDVQDMGVYGDESFDFFICSHVLEHVDDDAQAIRELPRVLASDGRGILMVPIIDIPGTMDEDPSVTDVDERWRRFGQFDHVRTYEKTVYLDRLAAGGFDGGTITWREFGRRTFSRNGIHRRSVLYVISKAARGGLDSPESVSSSGFLPEEETGRGHIHEFCVRPRRDRRWLLRAADRAPRERAPRDEADRGRRSRARDDESRELR